MTDSKLNRRTLLQGAAGLVTGLMAADAWADPVRPSSPLPTAMAPSPLTLEQSLRLAGGNLLAILNPDDDYLPYWEATVHKGQPARMSAGWPAHNLGRWWDAMLRLEEAIGFDIPKPAEKAMVVNVQRFFDNPDAISLSPKPQRGWGGQEADASVWDLHSLREGMLALHALVRWRKQEWAVETGLRMIRGLNDKLLDNGNWDMPKFDAYQKRGKDVIHNAQPCDTHGRMIEALIWFYEATGEIEALRFLDRLAHYHFENTTTRDGALPASARADHTHSYFGTLRGLLLYGRLTRQHEYIERVAAAYPVTVRKYVKESGYTSHNMVVESFGETTSPGDAAQLALWLSQDGHPEFLDDVERLVRCRILPSQIVEEVPLTPAANDGKDMHRDIAKRIKGAYGGCTSHPHGGKLAVTDVTGADVHTLVDIYLHAAKVRDGILEVPVHMDVENREAKVASRRSVGAEVRVTPKQAIPVAIRVPGWASRDSLRVTVGSKPVEPVLSGGYARLGRVPAGTTVMMTYDLPLRVTRENDLGVAYELHWRGDEVTGIKPNTDWLPMYPTAP